MKNFNIKHFDFSTAYKWDKDKNAIENFANDTTLYNRASGEAQKTYDYNGVNYYITGVNDLTINGRKVGAYRLPSSYFNKENRLPLIDKSGYNVYLKRNDMQRRLQKIKADINKKYCNLKKADMLQQVNAQFEEIATLKKEIITLLTILNFDATDYSQLLSNMDKLQWAYNRLNRYKNTINSTGYNTYDKFLDDIQYNQKWIDSIRILTDKSQNHEN